MLEPLRAGNALIWKGGEVATSRIVALVRTLVLARLLTPEDFGFVAIAYATVEVLTVATDLGMRKALVRSASPTQTEYDTVWTFDLLRAVVAFLLMLAAAPFIADVFFGEPRAANMIRVLSFCPILDYTNSIRMVDLTRALRFRPWAVVNVTGAVVHAGLAIALAPSIGAWGLVLGLLIAAAVQSVLTYVVAPARIRFVLDLAAGHPLFAFGKWVFAQQIVGALGRAALQAIVSNKLGVEALGIYFMATRIALLPREFIEKVVPMVAFPVYSRLREDAAQRSVFGRTLSGMGAALVPAYLIAIVLAPGFVAYVMGEQWTAAIPVMRLLALACCVGVVSDAVVPLLQARGHVADVAMLFLTRAVAQVAAVPVLIDQFSVVGAGAAWLLAEVVGLVYSVVAASRALPRLFPGIGPGPVFVLLASVAGAATSGLVARSVPGLPGFLLALGGGLAVGAAALRILDLRFHAGLFAGLAALAPPLRPGVPAPESGVPAEEVRSS